MRKNWFNFFMGMFVLLFADSCGVSYNVGDIVSELADGETVVLQNNGGDDLEITANSDFTFPTTFLDGGIYNVMVLTQPDSQLCRVNNGSGTINGVDVTNITITCSIFSVAIAAGANHTVALKSDGTVWAWGDGARSSSSVPVQVSDLVDITSIAGEYYFSIALKNDGTIWGWGDNYVGQLGDGTTIDSTTPVQVLLTP